MGFGRCGLRISHSWPALAGHIPPSWIASIPFVLSLPFPTMVRAVSGKNKRKLNKLSPERIARSQKIHLHPKVWAKSPPRTGPRLGAALVLVEKHQNQTGDGGLGTPTSPSAFPRKIPVLLASLYRR